MATSRRAIHLIPLLGLLTLGLSSATRLLLEPIPLASQPRSSPVAITGTETADHDTAEQKGVVGEAGQGHNIIGVKRARGNGCGQSGGNVGSDEIHIPSIGVPSLDLPGIGGIPSLDLPGIGLPGIHFPGINIGSDATEHDGYKCSPVNPNPPCAPSCNNPSPCCNNRPPCAPNCNNPPPCAPNCYYVPTNPPPCTLPGCYIGIQDSSNKTSQHETDSSSSKSLEGLGNELRAVRPKLDERVPDVLSTGIDSYTTEPKPPATPPMA